MERRESNKLLKRVLVSLLTLTLVLTASVLPIGGRQQNTAYADTNTNTNTNPVTLTARLEKSSNKTTDKIELTIGVETIEGLQLSGVQFNVEYPKEFTLIEKEEKDFFENGVSFFGPFKGEPGVTETANPMFCGFGSHGTNDEQREYVIKQKGDLVTFVFEANQPLEKEKQYTFFIQDSDETSHPEAFLLTTNAETNKPETFYYDITNAAEQIYKPTYSGGTIDGNVSGGTTIKADTNSDESGETTIVKKQVIEKALTNAGNSDKATDIVIDAKNTSSTLETKLEISKDSLGAIAAAEKVNSLLIQTNEGQLSFSKEAAEGIHKKKDGETLVITVNKKDTVTAGNEQKIAVDFSVEAKLVSATEEKPITEFGGGKVEVKLDLPEALQTDGEKDDEKVKCWYYTERNYVEVEGQRTDNNTKFAFLTSHFSTFMLATQRTWDAYNNGTRTPGVTVSGTATSWNNKDNTTYLLYSADIDDATIKTDIKSGQPARALDYTATKGEISLNENAKQYDQIYAFAGIPAGTYKLAIYKPEGYVIHIESITVSGANIEKNVQLGLVGDVNADGTVSIKDVTRLRQYIKTPGKYALSEVGKRAANVNGDNVINIKDVTRLRQHIKTPGKYPLN